ncbi:hypothetical protein [Streptomyces sp. NPDC002692]
MSTGRPPCGSSTNAAASRPGRLSRHTATAPDPEHRRFVLDVLHGHLLSPTSGRSSHEKETAELLVAWATEGEADPRVLADVLRVLNETEHRESPSVGLRYAGHPAPQVRAQVPDLLLGLGEGTPLRPLGEAARAALLVLAGDKDRTVRARAARTLVVAHDVSPGLTDAVVGLLRDPEAEVRARTAEALANSTNRGALVADALAALLDDEDFTMRLDAAYGLLRRDDPRTGEAIERLGPLSRPGFEHDPRLSALWRWKGNREKRGAPDDTGARTIPAASLPSRRAVTLNAVNSRCSDAGCGHSPPNPHTAR